MEQTQKKQIQRSAVAGGIMIMILLVLGTVWTGRYASEDSQSAVRTVSLIYLDELTERREQVVASTLAGYISNLDVAIGLLGKEDLSDKAHLEAYQARMKQLYGLEKFAFVDEAGLIYTSRGIRTDIDQYRFDFANISEAEISIKNPESTNKKVVIAVPVDRLPFEGKTLVACFMEIDMGRMLKNISLQEGADNNTTFCNLYTHGGMALTNAVLGGLASENNLLTALESASFEDGHSLAAMREDFQSGQGGVVSFTYKGMLETMCYVPVHGTDWMLTYLVRESAIGEKVSPIYEGIVSRSLAQTVLTVLVLVMLAGSILMQTRKAAAVTLEKEISETENRVKQQELEEQLALQEELLAQEKKRTQQDSMITALASDYRSVYYVDVDGDKGICYRREWDVEGASKEGESFSFRERFTAYAHRFVAEEYRAGFLDFIRPAAIREALEKSAVISYRYLANHDGKESYEMLKMARAKSGQEEEGFLLGVGFTDIDEEMRDSMEKSQALSDALKSAEEASKAKTVFLSNMSHEIRTPMNAIIGLDSLALHEPDLPESTRNYLEKIDSSARHLLSLINDILDMSRIESGRMTLRSEEFSFAKFIEQVNTIAGGQCEEKGVKYDCRISGAVAPYYIGDHGKLRQAIINLLGNAVKFTPKGGSVDFLVERTGGFDGKSAFRFTVKDTGIGMSKEFLPKIFDTFSQEDAVASNKYGSSGLGMAITKNIIEMMNGQIEVESEKGVGTTFTVTLTLLDSDKSDEAKDNKDVEIRPQDINVLVVDDDPIACEHAKVVLGRAGISTETALSGKEALEMVRLRLARREPYQLIVVDWHMPDMDGVEVTRQIRSIIGHETAIVILTAYNWEDVMEEAIAAGVDSFISKPLFFASLIEEFKNTLKKKQPLLSAPTKKAELKGIRVLLAEDMVVNAEIMKEVLSMREIQSELAENGKIAVEMFASHPEHYYDAILMDMRMPEMNGLEATAAIRAMKRDDAKTIPIIALTANAFDEDVQRSLQAGLNAHLSKPVDPEILFRTLENMLAE